MNLRKACDTLIVIPNQRLMTIIDKNTTLVESFKMSDSILHHASKGISDLINVHGLVNLDFADVVTVMKNMGEAVMGTGIASGEEEQNWQPNKQYQARCLKMHQFQAHKEYW